MNNKPIAWKIKWDNREWLFSDDENDIKMSNKHKWQSIPLYTAPKEITDEEIIGIVADKYEKGHGRYIDTDLFFIEFARALFKKAREK